MSSDTQDGATPGRPGRRPSAPAGPIQDWPTYAETPRLPMLQWRNVVVVLERGLATPDDYAQSAEIILAQAQRFPRGLGILTLLPPDATTPSDAARQAVVAAYTRLGPILRGVTFCVEATDFRGAAVRATLAGMQLVLRPEYPLRITDTLPDAARWIVRQAQRGSQPPVDPRELVQAIEERRARL
jgi:hypothetical protein